MASKALRSNFPRFPRLVTDSSQHLLHGIVYFTLLFIISLFLAEYKLDESRDSVYFVHYCIPRNSAWHIVGAQ